MQVLKRICSLGNRDDALKKCPRLERWMSDRPMGCGYVAPALASGPEEQKLGYEAPGSERDLK
ncbi:hypothetical protein PAXRUDRAFT_826841 [Paxillus rubicundulus Ve08.2h10]|uniref:Uncharacterized protein n=1 Tax=Paxillus rubicundulus Ve08.2h10 TaxID=930991 RepID=A0A0D0DZ18_9AGAM|nr:hypothetical protein PAXRUDRAFT_826841 [Paxillus rubicundulus Ve08.2h10]